MGWTLVRMWLDRLLTHLGISTQDATGASAGPSAAGVAVVKGVCESMVIGPTDPLVIGPSDGPQDTRQRVSIGPATTVPIGPPARAAWDERGWLTRRDGSRVVYEGRYQVRSRNGEIAAFPGRIVVDGTMVVPYIADPPVAIKRHPKGPCFQLTQAPWFKVHWRRPATNVDDALLYVERVLAEVLR